MLARACVTKKSGRHFGGHSSCASRWASTSWLDRASVLLSLFYVQRVAVPRTRELFGQYRFVEGLEEFRAARDLRERCRAREVRANFEVEQFFVESQILR